MLLSLHSSPITVRYNLTMICLHSDFYKKTCDQISPMRIFLCFFTPLINV